FVASTSRAHRDDDSSSLRRHDRYGRHGRRAVREAKVDSLRREQRHNVRQGHDRDGDSRGLFALHARRVYTKWRIVRYRAANSSGEGESPGRVRGERNDVEGDRVQRGIGRFADRGRKIRLPAAVLRLIETDSVIRVYDVAGNVVETQEYKGDFKE